MNQPAELSAEGQRTLAALQKAASRALERKARLGQYAVVWRDGRPTILDDTISERDFLRADKVFNERMLAETPANARLTRMSIEARIKRADTLLARLESLSPLDVSLPAIEDKPARDDES